MQNKTARAIILTCKAICLISLLFIAYYAHSAYIGLSELKAIEMEQLRFTNQTADDTASIACRLHNGADEVAYLNCLYNPQ